MMYDVIFCVFGCATIDKYRNEILKINETWGSDARALNYKVLFFLGEEKTELVGEDYVYLAGVENDYLSASYKQSLGLKYIYENYKCSFIFVCGTDTYVVMDILKNQIQMWDATENICIGGHGDMREVKGHGIYYHSGAGFILSYKCLSLIYVQLENMVETWFQDIGNSGNLVTACDLALCYYLHQIGTRMIKRDDLFTHCNHRGWPCHPVDNYRDEIISCHCMSSSDFDEYTALLKIDIKRNRLNKLMVPDCTLVTSCFDLRKYHPSSRSVEETVQGMTPLLNAGVYLIIHSDSTYMGLIKEKREKSGFSHLTKYVEESYEDLWCAQYTDKVRSNREVYWPTRDERTCSENHLLQCNKFDFLIDAIENNYFNTTRFGWMDLNLQQEKGSPNIKICESYTSNMIPLVLSKIKDDKFHLQILNVCDKKFLLPENKREYYERYRWGICGSMYVCGKDIGVKILTRLKEVVVQTIDMGYGHGDELIFFDVLDEFYDDIARSYGDYGQILNNFEKPTRNLWYIYHNIASKYYNHGYYKECCECCASMLYSFDNHLIEMDGGLYKEISSMMLMSGDATTA